MLHYSQPELEIIRFNAEDILSSSFTGSDPGPNGGDDDDGSTIGEPGDDWDSKGNWFN